MDIIEAILNWFFGSLAPYTTSESIPVPLTIWLQVIVRTCGVYSFPIIIARTINRYTRRFVNSDLMFSIVLWPLAIPAIAASEIAKFLINISRGLFDRLIARLSRKTIVQDENGIVYVEAMPISDRVAIKDRKALFVQVKDHTGTHRIQLDPDLLADRFTVRDVIAWTFDINPKQYHPIMQT